MDRVHIISDRVGVIAVVEDDINAAHRLMEHKVREAQHALRNQGAPEEVVQLVANERYRLETFQIITSEAIC